MPNRTRHTLTARARMTAFGEVVLTFPFDRALVDEIKARIPNRFRDYDSMTKEWTVLPQYVDLAIAILLDYFPDADVPRRGQTWDRSSQRRAESWQPGIDHFSVLHLLPSAPLPVIDAAYRALAKVHHPDHGGNPAIMRQLTAAHEALCRKVSA